MRKSIVLAVAAAAALGATPADSQAWIGLMVGNMMTNPSYGRACYDGRKSPRPEDWQKAPVRAEQALNAYLSRARGGGDVSDAFLGYPQDRQWFLDGQQFKPKEAHDPWVSQVAHVEPAGLMVGNSREYIRALWRVTANDGRTLGTYDAWMMRSVNGYRVTQVKLYSTGSAVQPDPLKPFCMKPGDIELFQAAQAKKLAERGTGNR